MNSIHFTESGKLIVTDDEMVEQLDRERWSASAMKAFDSCPARWAGDRLFEEPPDPFGAKERGSVAHKVFEILFTLPEQERTLEKAKDILWTLEDDGTEGDETLAFPPPEDLDRWREEVWALIPGLWDIEDPTKASVLFCEQELQSHIGGVPIVGYIDRTDQTEQGVAIIDYKGLALDTPLVTPTGWTTMGEVQLGDYVMGTRGPTVVTLKSGIHHRPCYKITFDHSSSVVCDNVHLWSIDGIGVIDTDTAYELHLEGVALTIANPRFLTEHRQEPEVSIVAQGLTPVVTDAGVHGETSGYRTVTSITPVASVATQCIQVDAEDSLYLAGPLMVPTHNTGTPTTATKRKNYGDDHGDQLRLYRRAMENADLTPPERASIYFTKSGESYDADLSRSEVDRVEAKFVSTFKAMKKAAETRTYPTKTSALCGWCMFATVCPSAARSGRDIPRAPHATRGAEMGITVKQTDSTQEKAKPMNHQWSRDGKPWEERSSDGGLNPASYTATAVISIASWAMELAHANGRKSTRAEIDAIANTLTHIIASIQVEVSHNGKVDWASGLNKRIRAVLHGVVRITPPPKDETGEFSGSAQEWSAWVNKCTQQVVSILNIGYSLWTDEIPDEPWKTFTEE